MGDYSTSTKSLLVLGILLVILAGFNSGNVPPIGYWGLYGQYFLLMGGLILMVLAIVLMSRQR